MIQSLMVRATQKVVFIVHGLVGDRQEREPAWMMSMLRELLQYEYWNVVVLVRWKLPTGGASAMASTTWGRNTVGVVHQPTTMQTNQQMYRSGALTYPGRGPRIWSGMPSPPHTKSPRIPTSIRGLEFIFPSFCDSVFHRRWKKMR